MSIYLKTFISSLVITVVLFVAFIPFFRDIKFGQMIREEGPKAHYKKAGTPTMGGSLIVLGSILSFLMVVIINGLNDIHYIILLIFPTLIYGLIGLIDDYLIVVKKNNQGLKPNLKLFLQIISAVIYFYIFLKVGLSTKIKIFKTEIDFKWFYGVLILLMLLGSSNAVNITDGIDGLCGGLVIIALFSFSALALHFENQYILIFCIAMIGSIISFLCYNVHPAKIFMGDAGSLALGASLANIAILLKVEILLIIIGLVFVLETLSVIIQVTYFKLTKGKRIFLMSPLHHHFELKGYSEWQVDLLFWFLALISAFVGIFLGVFYF